MVTRTSFHGMDDVAVLTLDNPDKKNAMTGTVGYGYRLNPTVPLRHLSTFD